MVGVKGAIGAIAPPKTYESNFIHDDAPPKSYASDFINHDFVHFGKQHSRYKAILPFIALYFIFILFNDDERQAGA